VAVSASGIGAGTLPIAESIKDFGLQWAEKDERSHSMPWINIRSARAGDGSACQAVRDLLSRRMPKALWGLCLATALLPAQAQEVYYIHTDALGSPVAETDANRNVVRRYEYEPYGQRLNGGNDDKPGYTGHVMDAVTGLVQMEQRYYDPESGRFLSVDPVTALDNGDMRHFNRYAYAYNNPYKFTDPDGRNAVAFIGGVVTESWNAVNGRGFDGSMVMGALADGYNGEGDGFAAAAFQDAATLIPAGAVLRAAGAVRNAPNVVKVRFERGATRKSPPQVRTSSSVKDAQKSLEKSGYVRAESKDGKATVLSKDGKSYTFYKESKSTGGPSADVKVDGKTVAKIRFNEKLK
jgi:RHS repeat-associated protein